jgi:hypothetical protein
MKNKFIRIAFIVLAIIAFSSSSKEQVNFRFNVTITKDNCSPSGYQGNYVISFTIKLYGNVLCSGQKTGISYLDLGNPILVSKSCDVDPNEELCDYELDITVCRQTSPLTCCNSIPFTGVCWGCLVGYPTLCNFSVSL